MGSKETPIQKACMSLLKANNIVHFRQQSFSGVLKGYGQSKGYHVNQGMKGLSDILAMLPDGNGFLFIEVKAGKGKQSNDQKTFEKHVIESGGHYIVVYSWLELAKFLDLLGVLKVRI